MDDTCTIVRDKPGVWDDAVDPDTLELVAPPGDGSEVYSGECLFKPVSSRDMHYEEGDQPVFRKVYNVLIPKDADEILIGDKLTCDTSARDETLPGVEFHVMEVRRSTHSVYRLLRVEDVQQEYNPTNPTT